MLLVQLFPLGILGKSWDKTVARMLKAWDVVQRRGMYSTMAKERENQVWGWRMGTDGLET